MGVTRRRSASTALAFSVVLALAAPASAGPLPTDNPYDDPDDPYGDAEPDKPSEPPWKAKLRREALLKEVQSLVNAERYQEALDKVQQAIEIRSGPDALLWKGFVEERLGNLLKAKRFYLQAQADALASGSKQDTASAALALEALAPQIPRIVIHLPAGVSDAEVELDQARVALLLEGVEVEPGPHAVLVKARDRETYQSKIVSKPGEVVVLEVALPPKPTPAPAVRSPSPNLVEPAHSGPPGGAIALGIIGGVLLVASLPVIASGISGDSTDGNNNGSGPLAAGAVMAVGGLSLGLGGLIWGFSAPKKTEASIPQDRRPPSSARLPIDVWVSPTPHGVWVAVGGWL